MSKDPKPVKVVDAETKVHCAVGSGLIREETWELAGAVVRYNLAFINHHLFAGDNGRVLGYDTSHGYAHRHYAGTTEAIGAMDYDDVFDRFLVEVAELRKRSRL